MFRNLCRKSLTKPQKNQENSIFRDLWSVVIIPIAHVENNEAQRKDKSANFIDADCCTLLVIVPHVRRGHVQVRVHHGHARLVLAHGQPHLHV